MLEITDLSRRLSREEYKRTAPQLRERMGDLQRRARRANVPVIIVFEGWEASGKGTLINELIRPLDPRGFRVHYVHSKKEEPQSELWPPMRRFWEMIPARGTIGVFSKSWYRLLFDDADPALTCGDIASFERQLSYDGYVIIKFFLHISRKEQKKRLKKMDMDDSSAWRVSEREWRENDHYGERARMIDEIIQRTDSANAPWTLVEAHDRRYAVVKILTTVVKSLETALGNIGRGEPEPGVLYSGSDRGEAGYSEGIAISAFERSAPPGLDTSESMDRGEYDRNMPKLQNKLRELQYELYKARMPMVIVFEGQDAAGKGGCIKRLTQRLDPRGYQVAPTAAPNDWERAHHYLWRFWTAFPKAGHIGIYDRSWYGRVLVERVEGFCPESEWRRAYAEMNEMEDQWCRYGTIIVKFWLRIDADEQLARFTERQRNPDKNWKITDEDWRNREKWPMYEAAAEEMLLRTSTVHAPWTIVEARDKLFARTEVLRKAIDALESALYVKM